MTDREKDRSEVSVDDDCDVEIVLHDDGTIDELSTFGMLFD